MLPRDYRFPFSPYPDGWFAVAWSHEVAAGQVLPRHYMGRDLVLYRTRSGRAVLADAYCPHLGAHLGHSGSVEGEELRCAFHGFCFAPSGDCSRTAYGSKAPPRARLTLYPVHEHAGMILAWFHHAGEPPTWRVPELPQEGWSALSTSTRELRTHPQETTENSVDMGHLVHVHLYRKVAITRDLVMEGPNLTVSYRMTRDGILGRFSPEINAGFDVMVHGLGYSLVEVEVQGLGLRTRHYVMNTPIDGNVVHLRAGVSMRTDLDLSHLGRVFKRVPGKPIQRLLQPILMHAFLGDMAQDYVIWETKKYEARPALAQGDGPVPAFRRWARQFYGPVPGQEAQASGRQPEASMEIAS